MNPIQLADRERYIIDAEHVFAVYEHQEIDSWNTVKTGEIKEKNTGILWWKRKVDVPVEKVFPVYRFSLKVHFKNDARHALHYGNNEALMREDKKRLIAAMKGHRE